MRSQRGYTEITGVIIMLAILGIGWIIFDSISCHSRWGRSGMNVSYGIFKGCTVQVADGRWIPEDRVREVDTKTTR